ncbi:bis(5'-nucleosyl)-tetraphosphatase (symmetrical) YqeK, partial [Melissococcus plutonius]
MSWTETYTIEQRDDLIQKIQKSLSEKRLKHVLRVEQSALALAEKYGVSKKKASIAALVHDYAKERPDDDFRKIIKQENLSPELLNYGNEIWHGAVGIFIIRQELEIEDKEILEAVRLHTTGAAKMSTLDKIIYVADYIEEGRSFPGVEEARTIAFIDLDEAVAYEAKQTLIHLIENERKVYPKSLETY